MVDGTLQTSVEVVVTLRTGDMVNEYVEEGR
jgi:hypothetical protein